MTKLLTPLVLATTLVSGMAMADNGLIKVKSAHSVEDTANKLEEILAAKGMNIFGRVNHAAGAKKADLELNPTEVVIFGNPKIGTPLMKCQPTIAIDLPQKALIWQDYSGDVWLAYNDPAALAQRHDLQGCEKVLEKVTGALANFAKAATSS